MSRLDRLTDADVCAMENVVRKARALWRGRKVKHLWGAQGYWASWFAMQGLADALDALAEVRRRKKP